MDEATLPLPAKAHAAAALGLALLAAAAAVAAPPAIQAARGETPAAREQARLCERLNLEEGLAACRAALALGIGPDRQGPVREILARHLVALERWDELVELLRESVQLEPGNAAAWQRLGLVLLFALDEPRGDWRARRRRRPDGASARLGSVSPSTPGRGRRPSGDQAPAPRPAALDGRPAARALLEAARRGERGLTRGGRRP
jgi:tetratricopeptide (TPR) repeat protein